MYANKWLAINGKTQLKENVMEHWKYSYDFNEQFEINQILAFNIL